MARGADRPRDRPGVARRRGARARSARRELQRDLVRRPGGGDRRRDRRRGRQRRERREAPARATRRRARRVDRRGCPAGIARDAEPLGVRDVDSAPGGGAPRHHGGSARRVLRAARARLCARGGGVHAGRADAQPGAEPDALLAGIARRPRVSAAAAAGCALSGRAVTSRPQAEGRAHRRGRGRGRRSRVAAAAGNVADSLVQGQGPAGPSRRRTRDVQPEDDPDRHRPEPRAASDPGRGQRRGPRWTGGDGRPGGRRQLGRALGQHRLERRLRRDGGIDRRCGRPHARRRSRSRQLFGAEDQGRRSAGPGRQGGLGQRPQRAHRLRRPARRPRLRPGPGHPQARGTQAARGSCPRSTVSQTRASSCR